MNAIIKYVTLGMVIAATSMATVSPSVAQSNGGKGGQSAGQGSNGNGGSDNGGGRSPDGGRDGGDGGGGVSPLFRDIDDIYCVAPCYPEGEIILRIPPPTPKPTPTVAQRDSNECQFLFNQITKNNMLVTVPRYNRCIEQSGG